MSKLSWHFQGRPPQIVDIVKGAACEWVKMIDPPEGGNPFPNKKIVGRIWIGGDGVEGEYVRQGADGARAYLEHRKGDDAARLLDYMLRRPYVTAWEGPNEPQPIDAEWFRPLLNEFEIQRALLLELNGLKSVVLCLNESALKSAHEAEQVGYAAQQGSYVGLHMYAAPAMWDIADLERNRQFLHYRAVYEWWREAGFDPALLFIGEMGIDGGVIGQGGTGWRTHTEGEDEYMEQLAWADERMIEDAYVEAGFVFTAGADPDKFRDFDLITSLSRKMAMHTHTHPHEEESPPYEHLPENEPKEYGAKMLADKVRWWIEEYTRQKEAGNQGRADAILYSLIKRDGGLLYRLENILKAERPN